MQAIFTAAEVLFTLLVWGLAVYFTVLVWRELRRIKAAYDARMALARARKSVAEAMAKVEANKDRLYLGEPSWVFRTMLVIPEIPKEPTI